MVSATEYPPLVFRCVVGGSGLSCAWLCRAGYVANISHGAGLSASVMGEYVTLTLVDTIIHDNIATRGVFLTAFALPFAVLPLVCGTYLVLFVRRHGRWHVREHQ